MLSAPSTNPDHFRAEFEEQAVATEGFCLSSGFNGSILHISIFASVAKSSRQCLRCPVYVCFAVLFKREFLACDFIVNLPSHVAAKVGRLM
jgi:hypothetical protein